MFVVVPELFAGAVKAGFERYHADADAFGHLVLAVTLLRECQQRAILGLQLVQRVSQGVEFLRVDRGRNFRNFGVFVRLEWGEKFLPPLSTDVVDARIPRQTEKPGFELGRLIETWKCANHFDEYGLGEVFDGITAARDGVDKSGYSVLIAEDERSLGVLASLLSLTNQLRQRRGLGNFHARALL
jgi:hypothetical protein